MGRFSPAVLAAVLVVFVGYLPSTTAVKPTITIGLSYISLDYDAKAVPGRTTVTCSAPTSVALCFLRLSRVVSYGPSTGRSVILAEVDNAEKWTNPDVAKLPNTEVSGVASQRRISYTLTKVSCLDAGNYTCTLCVDEAGSKKNDTVSKVLKVTVSSGPVSMRGNKSYVVTSPKSAVELTCVGAIGTSGFGERVGWIWEFKAEANAAAANSTWTLVTGTEKAQIQTFTDKVERYCIAVQTTTLTIRPEPGDKSGQYRCYVKRDGFSATEFAQVFTVDVKLPVDSSTLNNLTEKTTSSTNAGSSSSSTNQVVLWALLGILGALSAVTLVGVIYVFYVRKTNAS